MLHTFQKPIVTPNDAFGSTVAAVGENVVIGAPLDDTGAFETGAAYLFQTSDGALIRRFLDPHPATGNAFGSAIVAVGTDVAISAPGDDAAGIGAGAAYLFDGQTGAVLRAFLNPSPFQTAGQFGAALAAIGNNVVVEAPRNIDVLNFAVAAYLFDSATGGLLRTFLPPPNVFFFGSSIAVTGGTVIIGSQAFEGKRESAAAVLLDGTTGDTVQTLTDSGGSFGGSVAVGLGNRIIVGSPGWNVELFDVCGDGIRTAGEQCDDGNEVDGDCCSSHCEITNNLCDDGIACTVADECVAGVCVGNPITCGDGIVETECGEQCDDGNQVNGDGCDAHCRLEVASPSPTPTPSATASAPATPSPSPSAVAIGMTAAARKCQSALAADSRAFADIAYRQLQRCLDLILQGIARGETARLGPTCRGVLNAGDASSLIAKAKAKALRQIEKSCTGVSAADIHTPCNDTLPTVTDVAECILEDHAAMVARMVSTEYRDACALLSVFDIHVDASALCTSP